MTRKSPIEKIKLPYFLWLILLGISFSAICSNPTDYFRSKNSGNWSSTSNWESSADNSSWTNADLIPTSNSTYITIQTGHIISVDGTVSASTILIDGSATLTFDGIAARTLSISNDLIINNTLGSFIVQSAGSFTNAITISGDIINQGTFDLSRGTLTTLCDITFSKNGNQTVSGNGSLTRFNEITLDLGTSNSNILEISTSNFSAPDGFLESSSGVANRLKNGTLKLSGTFTYSGCPFIPNTYNNMIVSTAGFWINNPNVTITAFNDTFDVTGKFRLSQGSMSIGTTVGSCLKYATGSQIIIEGGNLSIISRIQGKTVATSTTTFNQSGGTINLMTSNLNSSATAALDFTAVGSSFSMSGGTIIFQNENGTTNKDVNIQCSTNITGGTFQFGNSSTLNIPDGFVIQSDSQLPSLNAYSVNISGLFPQIKLSKNSSILGDLTINNSTTFDVSNDGGTSNFDLSVSGNFINNGTFTNRNKTITFNGSNAQIISGSTTTNFYSVTINNSSPTGISLSSPITIDGALTLTDGNIYSTSINSITLNSGATSNSGSINSYVDGPITKIGNTDFIFPLGNNSKWKRLGISNLTGNETFTANYTNSSYSNTSSYNPEINPLGSVSSKEYWSLTKIGFTQANLELFWENASQSSITDCAELKIAYWDSGNSYWEKANNSDNVATTGSCSSTNNGSIITTSPLTDFGIFTFGSTGFVVLPIKLNSFQVVKDENRVAIKWETLSEKNNAYFLLEKSKDGINFEIVSKIIGSLNHIGSLKYETFDNRPFEGISYYKISQIDTDGKSFSYPLQSILFEKNDDLAINVYPNPIRKKEDLYIQLNDQLNHVVTITIVNILGIPLMNDSRIISHQNEVLTIHLGNEYPKGVYYIQIVVNNISYSKKIVVQD